MFETCSYACEIDFTEILNQQGNKGDIVGHVDIVQSEGTLRLVVYGVSMKPGVAPPELELKSENKPGQPKTKVHRYKFK